MASFGSTNLAGIVYFLPLRIVGARVREPKDRNKILQMLKEIERRGYVVAEAFIKDLQELWKASD
jgi:hypothetical protein